MYLSKLEIIGFKSFAQRINISFDAGVTAIVGPNGCGKTNIVDAIRWVLGEQRYSTLRSDKMEDVIFNGTKNRKPLGLAEVSLTIENTKGILPTDYSEVTITRRVFRSGESEYLLNKVPCRLKDIIDLFMDTGMGSDAYSVIELKMVETILSDKADERRKLFEEAAGVTKYKLNRKAAVRKLEDVQQDLARVNDIVKEVQKTVSSLERQAKKAEQYNEVSSRLKALEIDLLEREYAYLNNKLKPLQEKYSIASADKAKIDEILQSKEKETERLRNNLIEIEKQLSDIQKSAAQKFDELHHIEEKIIISQEKRNALTSNIERYKSEKVDLISQRESLSVEKQTLIDKKQGVVSELEDIQKLFNVEKEEYSKLTEQVEAKKIEVDELKNKVLTLAHEIVEKRGDQDRVKSRIENLKGRIERSEEDTTLYKDDIKRVEEQIKQLTFQDKELRKRLAEAEVQLFNKQQIKDELKKDIDVLRKRSVELAHEIDRRISKIEFLQRMLDGQEGFLEGTKYFLKSEKWKKKNIVTIGDIIRSDEKYRIALDAALAEMANVLIVENIDDGFAAIEELKTADKGKSSFICLQWVPKIYHRRKTQKGNTISLAVDVVQCEAKYQSLINFLLDDVVIVESLQEAKEVLSSTIGIRCVTLDGQMISSSGILYGGSQKIDEGSYINKKAKIVELEKEIDTLKLESQKVSAEQQALQEKLGKLGLDIDRKAVKEIERDATKIEMRIAQLEFEKKRANDGIERNSVEIMELKEEILELQKEYEDLGKELKNLEEEKINVEAKTNTSISELELLESQWNDKTKVVNDLEIKVITTQGNIQNLEKDLERIDARCNDIGVTLGRRQEEIERALEEIERIGSEIASYEKLLEELREEYKLLDEQKAQIEQNYSTYRNELHQLELKIKDERRLHDDSVSITHELDMKISEIKSNMEHVKLRAQEEFELDLQLKTYQDDEWVDFAHLREEVKNLKDRIRILGAINFAAFDEFNTESERLNFLTQQRDDLIEAEKTLMRTIEEINNTAQRKFLETFAKIRTNFIATFKELFMEGDECDLKLEEGVDPLEAAIEIIAKPRGKRPTSIDLLSGGEKTLTAIALLFAIYLVKPSPFCILDEVDAPLDDSNIDRFTRILKKFSDNTQFIVITHNKRTMEAAQALYGVTMEEEGVSKIVTVRFNEESRVRSASVTN